MLRIFILLISLFFCIHSYGIQPNIVNFKNIDNKKGLSQNGITSIFQDRDGYMWFGTHYGLNRYDGINIKTFYAGNSFNELSDNTINSITQDFAGNIWIATEQGLTVYNPITHKLYNLKKYNPKNSVFGQHIQSIKLIDGKIMFTSQNGLWSISSGKELFTDENTKSICEKSIRYKISASLDLESLKIHEKDKNGNYWLTNKNQVILTKISSNKLIILTKIRIEPSADVTISAFFQDNFSNIWIGTQNKGLFHLKGDKGNYLVTKIYPKKDSTVNFSRIANILQDHQNNLIVTSRADGAIKINKEALRNNDFTSSTITAIDLPTRKIKSIFISRDKTLWIGSLGNGVFFQNNSGLKFKNYQIKDYKNNSIVSNTRSIIKDENGNLWVGTLFEGLFIYDTTNQLIVKSILNGKSIFALSKIDNKHILVGASDGLYLVTFEKNNYITKKLNTNNKTNPIVFSIAHVKNHYWLGTDNNLMSFTLTNDFELMNLVTYKNLTPSSLNSINFVRIVKYDPAHNFLWIGTQTKGLVVAKLNNDFTINNFSHYNQNLNSLDNNDYICDILLDNKNNSWVGTKNGLFQIKLNKDGVASKIKKITIREGLPSNLIQSIETDKQENIWIGTNRGLVKLNQAYKTTIYDINDGIQNYEFTEHSCYSDSNGLLYFGGIDGISSFSPNKTKQVNYNEPVNISDIIINGINVNDRRPKNDSSSLKLRHFENNLKINFLSPNYYNQKNCKYSYILEGFDENWLIASANTHEVNYKNLPPGNYTFKMKVSNEDGKWESEFTSLSIVIKPLFWLTFPAFCLYLIVLYFLIKLISSITKKRLDKKNKEQLEKQYQEQMERINKSKLEFFINISHEIRTPLTLILCSIEKLISNFKLNPKQEKEALTIDKQVNNLLELTNELLAIHKMETGNYQLKVQKNEMISFLKNIKVIFKSLAKSKEIKISIESFEPELFIWFDKNALGKIMYNLVSNAIKHTSNGGRIIIKAFPSADKGFLIIKVIDNGSGIDPNYISKIFNRFYHHGGNMDRYVNGFGIGLSLTKSMVELHKGTISVTSEMNIGTTFTLNLPLDENTYSNEEKSDRILWDNDMPRTLSTTDFDENDEVVNDELVAKNIEFNAEKPTILYVDDNIDLIENMADYFSGNYNIYTAENGEIGVKMANELQPDIIISDVVMPIINGLELCKILKNDIKTSHIPIILLTSQGDMNTQFEGVNSGADYFVPKPFNIKILNLTIKNLIESRNKVKNLFLNNKYEDAGDLTTNSKDKEFIEKLLKYVNDNIEVDNLNIINIADEFSMSRSTFFRKVKIITGTTGKEFIDSVRLKKATALLLESDLNISEVAYSIGHSNPQYFSKWFKSHCKMSPSEYILKNKLKD
ncbi:two-component regulator propeller domain-containing protein [Flavobacterium sp.]|jgi:signal transduction histidine kinase/ligand-binding sensor domain-containing protein/DNA-binding response OmpR family regulator|uniref:hybrid sensor histidine kinase/response regulator transcription factor n=1 Tax=Flavobacterium sp. TaxID=239 RepID=UPI0037C0DF57